MQTRHIFKVRTTNPRYQKNGQSMHQAHVVQNRLACVVRVDVTHDIVVNVWRCNRCWKTFIKYWINQHLVGIPKTQEVVGVLLRDKDSLSNDCFVLEHLFLDENEE